MGLLGYLAIGVPLLLAIQLANGAIATWLPLSIAASLGAAALAPWPRLLRVTPYRRFLVFFFVLGAATAVRLIGDQTGEAREQVIELLQCFMWLVPFLSVPFLISDARDATRAWRLIDLAGVGVTLSLFGAYVARQQWGVEIGEVLIEDGAIRSFGPFGDQVGFTIMLFALLAAARHQGALALLHGGAVLFTATRGAIIALVFGAVWLLWLELQSSNRVSLRKRAVRTVLVLAVGLATFLASPLGQTALDRVLAVRITVGSVAQRFAAMQLGMEVAGDHLLTGVGYMGFRRQSDTYRFDRMAALGPDPERAAYSAQNQLVQTATDAGVFGLLAMSALFLALYAAFARTASSPDPWIAARSRGLAACVAAIALGNQGAVWILPAAITGYLFFLICSVHLRVIAVAGSNPSLPRSHAYRPTVLRR